jgi:hypothetical protein
MLFRVMQRTGADLLPIIVVGDQAEAERQAKALLGDEASIAYVVLEGAPGVPKVVGQWHLDETGEVVADPPERWVQVKLSA